MRNAWLPFFKILWVTVWVWLGNLTIKYRKMTDKEFCKIDTEFYGEVVDNIKQIKLRSFDGEELKEYVEHCIKLNLLTIPVVVKSF